MKEEKIKKKFQIPAILEKTTKRDVNTVKQEEKKFNAMKIQFRWYILAITLLCIACLPFGFCDNNGKVRKHTISSRNARFQQRAALPLRDDSDYIREHEKNDANTNLDDYDDDGNDDEYTTNSHDTDEREHEQNNSKTKKKKKQNDKNDVQQQQSEIVEQAQSTRTQIIQRPKEFTDVEVDALFNNPSSTPSADTSAPTTIEMCPNECSCSNECMTCTRIKHLPKVPEYILSL